MIGLIHNPADCDTTLPSFRILQPLALHNIIIESADVQNRDCKLRPHPHDAAVPSGDLLTLIIHWITKQHIKLGGQREAFKGNTWRQMAEIV